MEHQRTVHPDDMGEIERLRSRNEQLEKALRGARSFVEDPAVFKIQGVNFVGTREDMVVRIDESLSAEPKQGDVMEHGGERCPVCGGKGKVAHGEPDNETWETCGTCEGEGEIDPPETEQGERDDWMGPTRMPEAQSVNTTTADKLGDEPDAGGEDHD